MQLFGFSLNMITLFALVLAIGIVVDNAIVVVEAVHAKMEHSNIGAKEATIQAMSEISGAIIAITLVMSAVFVPVAFMSGPTGIFYRQFSLTMAISIVLSGIIALTLTPALCVLLLKNNYGKSKKKNKLNSFFNGFNNWYNGLAEKYKSLLEIIANRKLITFLILLIFCIASGFLGNILPTGFIPNEDQGTIYANIITPSGATLERTESVVDAIQQAANKTEGVQSVSTLAGFSLLSDGSGASFGMNLISLNNLIDIM